MADRYPLIANAQTKRIEELPTGDNLDLTNSGIVGASTITSDKFVGYLEGTAEFAENLNDAGNILAGTISSERLSGYYRIGVTTAINLESAENILSGTISSERLSGYYDIDVTRAEIVEFLQDAGNIIEGIINSERLGGVYNIDISGTSEFSDIIENVNLDVQYLTVVSGLGTQSIGIDPNGILYDPTTKSLSINTSSPNQNYNLYVNGSIGVGSSLDISGNLRLLGSLYDSNEVVGTTTSILISTGVGVSWTSIETALQGIPGILPSIATTSTPGLQPATGYGIIGYATTVTLDFGALNGQTNTIELAGDLELLASNLSNGREVKLRLIPGASNRTLVVPIDWKFYGDELTTLLANKESILSLLSFGSSDADVRIIASSQL